MQPAFGQLVGWRGIDRGSGRVDGFSYRVHSSEGVGLPVGRYFVVTEYPDNGRRRDALLAEVDRFGYAQWGSEKVGQRR